MASSSKIFNVQNMYRAAKITRNTAIGWLVTFAAAIGTTKVVNGIAPNSQAMEYIKQSLLLLYQVDISVLAATIYSPLLLGLAAHKYIQKMESRDELKHESRDRLVDHSLYGTSHAYLFPKESGDNVVSMNDHIPRR